MERMGEESERGRYTDLDANPANRATDRGRQRDIGRQREGGGGGKGDRDREGEWTNTTRKKSVSQSVRMTTRKTNQS